MDIGTLKTTKTNKRNSAIILKNKINKILILDTPKVHVQRCTDIVQESEHGSTYYLGKRDKSIICD